MHAVSKRARQITLWLTADPAELRSEDAPPPAPGELSSRDPVALAEAEMLAGEVNVHWNPDGTPEELMAYIDGVRNTNFRPKSREQAMAFFKQVAGTAVKVADKVLGQVEIDDDFYVKAAKLKLDQKLLATFPRGYRHLAYLQSRIGYKIKMDMPGLKGPAVEALYKRGADWLAGGAL